MKDGPEEPPRRHPLRVHRRKGPRHERRAADETDAEPSKREQGQREALAVFCGELTATLDLLMRRSCARLGALWCMHSATFLELMRTEMGLDSKDIGTLSKKEYKHAHLAAGLYLILFLNELDRHEPALDTDRKLVEAAYLPLNGRTDDPPYEVYRLPDADLALRVLGQRMREAEARERLKYQLLALLEGWWADFGGDPLAAKNPQEILTTRLVQALFRPTVFDALRLEKLRPAGRKELDFVAWRGEQVRQDRKPRGRPPSAPGTGGTSKPTPAMLRSFARMELPEAERTRVTEYLLFTATAAEIETFEKISRTVPLGAEEFDRRARVAANSETRPPNTPWRAARRAVSDLIRRLLGSPAVRFFLTEDHEVPGLVMFDADDDAGEAVVLDVRGASDQDWVIAFARVDHGPLTCQVPWQPATDPAMFFPPRGATELEVLSAITANGDRPQQSNPILILQALEQLGRRRVRWAASRFTL